MSHVDPPDYASFEDLMNKVDWEGGLIDALEYGILTCDGVPALLGPDLTAKCNRLYELYNEVYNELDKRHAAELKENENA